MTAHVDATTLQLDDAGLITAWPDTGRDLFRRTAADVLGKPFTLLVDARQRGACANVLAHVSRESVSGQVQTMDLLAERADGTTFPAECSMWRCAGDGTVVSRCNVLIRNVGSRVRVEEALRQELRALRQFSVEQVEERRRMQARFVDITGTIDEVFWIADPSISRMLYISPAYERVWGRTCQSLYDEPRSFLEAIHPDDRDRVVQELDVKRGGRAFDHEYRIVLPNGAVRWVWDRGFPVHAADGSVDRYIGVAQDVSARVAAEAAFRHDMALDAIGRMASGLAHEFGSLLGVLIGHLDLAGLALPESAPARENLDIALDAALRGSQLAQRLHSLADRERTEPRRWDLAEAVADVRVLLRHAVDTYPEVVVRAPAAPFVSMAPRALDAVLVTLALALRIDLQEGDALAVTVDETVLSDQVEPTLGAGRYASLLVEVDGSDDARDGFVGRSLDLSADWGERGYGLPMVLGLMREAGGLLRLEEAEDGRRRFRVLLPVAADPGIEAGETGPVARSERGVSGPPAYNKRPS